MAEAPNISKEGDISGKRPPELTIDQSIESTQVLDKTDRLINALELFNRNFQNSVQALPTPPPPPPPPTPPAQPAFDHILDKFLRFQPPKFFGEPDDKKADDWMEAVEKIFKVLGYSDDTKIMLATFLFESDAGAWWKSRERSWDQNNIPRTWANFLQEFNDKYVPALVREKREEEFNALCQGASSVIAYEAQFTHLIKYAPHLLTDEQRRTRKFIRGLRQEIQEALSSHHINTYIDAVERALRVESTLSKAKVIQTSEKRDRPLSSHWQSGRNQEMGHKRMRPQQEDYNYPSGPNEEVKDYQNTICKYCGIGGHTDDRCWKKAGKCLKCGSDKHFVMKCPQIGVNNPAGNEKPSDDQSIISTRPRVTGRAYTLDGEEKNELDSTNIVTGKSGEPFPNR